MRTSNSRAKWLAGSTAIAALGCSLLVASPASAADGDVSFTATYDGAVVPNMPTYLFKLDPSNGEWNYYSGGSTDGSGVYTVSGSTLPDGQYETGYDAASLPDDVAPYATFQTFNGSELESNSDFVTEFTVTGGTPSISSATIALAHNAGAFTVTAIDSTTGHPFVDDTSTFDELYLNSDYNYSSKYGVVYDSLSLDAEDADITGTLSEAHITPGAYERPYLAYYNDSNESTTEKYLPLQVVTAGQTTNAGSVTLVPNSATSVDTLITGDWTAEITGAPAVGNVLTAQEPTAPGVTFSYQWYTASRYSDVNRPIIGATSRTYVPTASDLSQQLTVDVVASAPGYTDDKKFSRFTTKPVQIGDPNAGTVAITGTASYGNTVTASVSTALAGANSFQWYLNGNPIAGATGSTYAIKSTDVGSSLSVSVKSTVQGHTDAVIPSAGVIVKSDTANSGTVSISGSAKFGKTVTAKVSTALAGNVSYKWFRNGTLVGGVDGSSYTIGKADLGTTLSVTATSAVQGHTDAVLVATVAIAKDAASVKATAKGDKVTVTLKPGSTNISATAKVKVYYTSTKFKTVTVKSGKSASVSLTKLKKGTHTVKVVYPGTASYAAKTVTVKVKVTK